MTESEFPRRPFHVLMTRAHSKCASFCATLEKAGLQVTAVSVQKTLSVIAEGERKAWKDELCGWDGLLMTSAQAVRFFLEPLLLDTCSLGDSGRAVFRTWLMSHVFCVGRATARACQAVGIEPVCTPEKQDAWGLVEAIKAMGTQKGKRYLFACSTEARESLSTGLEALGAVVHRLPVYTVVAQTLPSSVRSLLLSGDIDMVALNSPSQLSALRAELGEALHLGLKSMRWAAIGPTTAEALRQVGLEPWVISTQPSMQAFAQTILDAISHET